MQNQMNDENKAEKSKRPLLLWGGIALVVLLIVAEIFFHVIEIGVGQVLLLTNPIRPKTGRLWVEDQKEQLGIDELNSINESEEEPVVIDQQIHNFEELEAVLSTRSSLSMTRDEFKEFYRSLPIKEAKQLLDPLYLIELDRNPEWQRSQLSLSGDQLVLYILDGYEKPIVETHVNLRYPERSENVTSLSELDQLEAFRGRIIPASIFYKAFDQLPRMYRVQIVNDPYKLVQWGASLERVGISLFVESDGVEIIFEVKENQRTRLQHMYASEIAAGYLIKEINAIDNSPKLQMPVKKNDHEKDY